MTKEQTILKANELIRKELEKLDICMVYERSKNKSLQKIEIECILKNKNEGTIQKLLGERLDQILGNLDILNISFYENSDPNTVFDAKTGHFDIESIRLIISYIKKIKDPAQQIRIQDIIASSFIKVFSAIYSHNDFVQTFKTLEDCRVFVIFIMFLEIFGSDNSLFSKVKRAFIFLTDSQSMAIAKWLVPLEKGEMNYLVDLLTNGVMVWLLESNAKLGSCLEDIEAAMNVLSIINSSNKINQRVKKEAFVIGIFDQGQEEQMNPAQEFSSWIKSKKNKNPDKRYFSFCKYPFSMTLAFKYQILEANSKYEQKKQHQDMLTNLVNQGVFFVNQSLLYLTFEVGRESILQDSINAVSKPGVNYRLPFKVKFNGEQGIDEGGLRKEYYQIMIKQLFNPDFGLFKEKQNKQFNWFNGNSFNMPILYELIGCLMGIAIYNQIQMDVRFPAVIYKKLIGDPVSLEDIKQFDSSTYNGLNFILEYEGDIENDLQETFFIQYESFGETHSYELKPGGDSINVTNQNKKEYVDLYVDWMLNKSIENQFNNFKRGFFKVLEADIIKFFSYDELVLILTGLEEINFEELRASTTYEQGYTEDSPQVKWIWEILTNELNLEQKKRFIFFSTGSDRAPVTGLASLKFVISRHGDSDNQLPSAHTCFNHLLLPAYSSKEVLKKKLLLSLENAEGFGLF